MKSRKELADILTKGMEGGDIDMIWFVVGELEREVERVEKMREITLLVDEKWYTVIANLTSDVYEGETCTWLRNEVL